MKVSVVIPVYNERETVEHLVERVKKVNISGVDKEIIVVDDGSTDGTGEVLKGIKGIRIKFHEKNRGKGSALKTGIGVSTGDIILVQDADLEYSPEDYPRLIKPIVDGKAKVVYGSRLLGNNQRGRLWFYFGGITVTKFTNLLYRSKLTDEPTCYKVFHKDLRPVLLGAKGQRFEWEPEVTAKILKAGHDICEVPISYAPRKKGKKIGARDGIYALWTLLKYRIN